MDTRANFQRLLDDMDEVIRRKQQELSELDERLETAREQLSDREAKELLSQQVTDVDTGETQTLEQQDIEELLKEQRVQYEQQVTNLNYELIDLETLNQSLTKSNSQLRSEVDSCRVSNAKLKERLEIMHESLEEVQSANFELNIRLAKAESESQMQQKLLKKSHEQDQILMDAFNNKLESLKEAIAQRDDEIRRLHVDNQEAIELLGIEIDPDDVDDDDDKNGYSDVSQTKVKESQSLNELSHDRNKKYCLVRIANMIRDKDAQIEELRNQLVQATKELESSTNLFETINKGKRNESADVTDSKLTTTTHPVDEEKELLTRCKMLEDEMNEKDQHLYLVSQRNRHLEIILPNKIIDLIESLQEGCRAVFNHHSQEPIDSSESEHSLAAVLKAVEGLNGLLNEIGSSQKLLDSVDQLQRVVLSKDVQIKYLVRELNELNAKINQDQIDISQIATIPGEESKISQQTSESPMIRHDENAFANLSDSGVAHDENGSSKRAQEVERAGRREGQSASSSAGEDKDFTNRVSKSEVRVRTAGLSESGGGGVVDTKEDKDKDEEEEEAVAPPSNEQKQGTYNTYHLAENFLIATIGEYSRAKLNYARRRNKHNNNNLFMRQTGRKRAIQTKAKFTIDFRGRMRTATRAQGVSVVSNNNIEQQALNYRDRLKQLENENQLLELAMKEILMSIKWSDTRCSTILIDCPSLERLCQLIEARYIASHACGLRFDLRELGQLGKTSADDDAVQINEASRPFTGQALDEPSLDLESKLDSNLFQLIVMKSELDLLRGQNEQLRSDLKLQRREFSQQHALQHALRPHDLFGTKQVDDQVSDKKPIIDHAEELKQLEAECQTDSSISIDPSQLMRSQQELADDQKSADLKEMTTLKSGKCHNCKRLVSLANHLLDCIVRIESRVNASDETYINRFQTLYQLTRQLGHDLSMRHNLINQLRRDTRILSQQKVITESRLRSLQDRLDSHKRVCPLENRNVPKMDGQGGPSGQQAEKKSPADVQFYSATRNGSSQSVHSLTIRSNRKLVEVSLKDSRIAISLLQSIIACLQARLDYKDERLNQLEQLLVSN